MVTSGVLHGSSLLTSDDVKHLRRKIRDTADARFLKTAAFEFCSETKDHEHDPEFALSFARG